MAYTLLELIYNATDAALEPALGAMQDLETAVARDYHALGSTQQDLLTIVPIIFVLILFVLGPLLCLTSMTCCTFRALRGGCCGVAACYSLTRALCGGRRRKSGNSIRHATVFDEESDSEEAPPLQRL